MKTFLTAAILATAGAASAQLIWSDEFDTLNTTIWQPQLGTGSQFGLVGWGNNELQYYTDRPQNVRIENGELVIEARRENFMGRQYTSARLRTINQVDIQYGRIEARMRIPATQGIWPAFWMLPTNSPYGGWPMSGEIDIMESINAGTTIHGTLHFGNPWPNNASNGRSVSRSTSFAQNYHIYRVDWYPDRFEWFVDGVLYGVIRQHQWFTPADPDPQAPFNNPFHFIMNVAVGGNWPGSPDGSSQFPQQLRVDWVRVYELGSGPEQLPFNTEPALIPGVIQAEEFDLGGLGVAYHDVEETNLGGQFRTSEGVDIEARAGGGFNVGFIRPGEWIEYTINNPSTTPRTFDITAHVASLNSGGSFRLAFNNGSDPVASVDFTAPPTGGWQTWTTIEQQIEVPPGVQIMRFSNLGTQGQDFNIDKLEFALVGEPSCTGDIADDFGFTAAEGGGPNAIVDFGDFVALLGLIGPCPSAVPGCTGDIADDFGFTASEGGGPDGQVDFGDFVALLGLIGPCPG